MSQDKTINLPVGQVVGGDLYKGSDKDAEGKPLLVKSGPNTGQPRLDFYFAVAIPKGAEQHWASTPWGADIWATGHAAFPNVASSPKFAWKITDGDSAIPNSKGKKPCERTGYPGCWVVALSSGFAPKVAVIPPGAVDPVWDARPGLVNPGDYVEAVITVRGNDSAQQPGVFLNHSAVCLRGYGQRINTGMDLASAGFGAAALPAGASAVPLAGGLPPGVPTAPGVPAVPGAPPTPAAPAAVFPPAGWTLHPTAPGHYYQGQVVKTEAELRAMFPAAPVAPPVAATAPVYAPPAPAVATPVPVVPNTAVLAVPGVPAVPAAPPAPPAPPAVTPQMTAKAAGATYESFIKGGWTDELMRQHGMII
jgi:hypothetical protein